MALVVGTSTVTYVFCITNFSTLARVLARVGITWRNHCNVCTVYILVVNECYSGSLTFTDRWCSPVDISSCLVGHTGLVIGCGIIDVVSLHTPDLTGSSQYSTTIILYISQYMTIGNISEEHTVLGNTIWSHTSPAIIRLTFT